MGTMNLYRRGFIIATGASALFGQFAIPEPAAAATNDHSARERLDRAIADLKTAAGELYPRIGEWVVEINGEARSAVIVIISRDRAVAQ